jgi:hypothetical protein
MTRHNTAAKIGRSTPKMGHSTDVTGARRAYVASMRSATAFLLAFAALAFPATSLGFDATEGSQYSGPVASFTEACPAEIENGQTVHVCANQNPTATIAWGDGTTSTATLVKQHLLNGNACLVAASCTYIASGVHTYDLANVYSGTLSWSDATVGINPSSGTVAFPATVADPPIALASGSIARNGNDVTLSATLSDQNTSAQPCDYDVEVDWGDGTQSQATVNGTDCTIFRSGPSGHALALGIVPPTGPPSVGFSVNAQHHYATDPSTGVATVTATDRGGSTAQLMIAVPRPATTTTGGAAAIGQTSATLQAHVNPSGGTLSDCHFEWGPTTAYGQTAPCSPATFTAEQDVTAALSGLAPGTTYHYRIVATTDVGTVAGDDEHFTTLAVVAAGAPNVLTLPATDVTTVAATLHGVVNTGGPAATDCHFDWGTTDGYGQSAPCIPSVAGGADVNVTAPLTGLAPDKTYHFRIVAANAGAPPSAGADATFATLPVCTVTPVVGYIEARGCFAHDGDTYKSTPGSKVDLDGLTLTPDAATTTITIDAKKRDVTPSAAVKVSASDVVLGDSAFHWTEPDPQGQPSVKLGALTPQSGAKVEGLALSGDLSLSLSSTHGADLAGNAALPLGSLTSGSGLTGTVTMHTTLGVGLNHDELKITKDSFQVAGIGVKNLTVIYSSLDDIWGGSAQITLPTDHPIDIGADLEFQHGSFHKFDGSVSGIDLPAFGGVYVQRISVVFGVNPTTIGGGLGLSFGPTVDGKRLVGVDADFVYQAATAQAAGFIHANGSLTLASFKVANAYFDYYTTGLVKFGGHMQLGFPDSSSDNPQGQPVYIDTGFDGAVFQSKFDVDVKATVALNFIDTTVGAEVLVSDKGVVACATLSAFGFTWNPGVGYTWATHAFDPMLDGCSVGPWKTLDLGAAASAAGRPRTIRLPGAPTLVELRGSTGQPKVTLSGPHGVRIVVPASSVAPLKRPGYMVLQDPADRLTWIAIQHAGGAWRVATEPGSSPIVAVRSAALLPAPAVHAHLARHGTHRVLTWRARPLARQRITFWERGHDVARIMGSSAASHGHLTFTPAAGGAGPRTIQAYVTVAGHPRTVITVARFTAAAAALPGRPGHVGAKATADGGVRVSWRAAARAQEYRVVVADDAGARLVELAGATARSIVVRDVNPIASATVTVTALRHDGAAGRPVTVKFHNERKSP